MGLTRAGVNSVIKSGSRHAPKDSRQFRSTHDSSRQKRERGAPGKKKGKQQQRRRQEEGRGSESECVFSLSKGEDYLSLSLSLMAPYGLPSPMLIHYNTIVTRHFATYIARFPVLVPPLWFHCFVDAFWPSSHFSFRRV